MLSRSTWSRQFFNFSLYLTVLFSLFTSCNPPRYERQAVALKVQPSPQLLQRGKALVNMMCADCHRDPSTGLLSGKRLTDVPKMLGTVYSRNITQHPEMGIGSYTDGELAYLLRTGIDRHGRLQPLMQKPGLSDEDLQAVIAFLKYSDDPMVQPAAVTSKPSRYSAPAKLGMRVTMKPLPYPAAPVAKPGESEIAQGKYLVSVLGCHDCHSRNMLAPNKAEPEKSKGYLGGGTKLKMLDGTTIRTPNLTMDAQTGLKNWNRTDFVKALQTGIRPDHSVLRYPMPLYGELTEAEARAIFAYLQTVPVIKNRVKRLEATPVLPNMASADSLSLGKQLYASYGCQSCHGVTGLGIADLRMANQKYPMDAQLKARIQNPSAFDPSSRMPRFEGVIADKEYAPLLVYVRWLGKNASKVVADQ